MKVTKGDRVQLGETVLEVERDVGLGDGRSRPTRASLRDNNEDAFLVDDEHVLFAVADGMGGHRGGEVASHTAIEALRAAFASGGPIERRDRTGEHGRASSAPRATASSRAWARR